MHTSLDLRPSPIAGQYYPGKPSVLAKTVDEFLNTAQVPQLDGEVVGVIAPHAGHVYSGPVAGYAFAPLRSLQPEIVAIISPMHHAYPQPLLTTAHQAYSTPLGSIPVDRVGLQRLNKTLQDALGIQVTPVPNDPEHSLEIELPFLQRIWQHEFRLLPVMMRDQRTTIARALGRGLANVLGNQSCLLVASSDLSHFYHQSTAEGLDAYVLGRIEAFDPEGVLQAEVEGKGYACGRGAIAAVLWAAQELGANQVEVLQHATSGDVSGDYTSVVGYGAAVILRSLTKGGA